jgi:hypothetical protein
LSALRFCVTVWISLPKGETMPTPVIASFIQILMKFGLENYVILV